MSKMLDGRSDGWMMGGWMRNGGCMRVNVCKGRWKGIGGHRKADGWGR